MGADSEKPSGSLLGRIVAGVVIGVAISASAPWWYTAWIAAPASPATVRPLPPECAPETLRGELFRSAADKASIIKATARLMRERFRRREFNCVAALAPVLLEDDQDNGHGLYFSGEAWRVMKSTPTGADVSGEHMREPFFRYLEVEKHLPPDQRRGDGNACYDRVNGYCAERTAYICHLMAIDYFQQAEATPDAPVRIQLLRRVLDFLDPDLKFGGFDQIIPSAALKVKVLTELQSLGAPVR